MLYTLAVASQTLRQERRKVSQQSGKFSANSSSFYRPLRSYEPHYNYGVPIPASVANWQAFSRDLARRSNQEYISSFESYHTATTSISSNSLSSYHTASSSNSWNSWESSYPSSHPSSHPSMTTTTVNEHDRWIPGSAGRNANGLDDMADKQNWVHRTLHLKAAYDENQSNAFADAVCPSALDSLKAIVRGTSGPVGDSGIGETSGL